MHKSFSLIFVENWHIWVFTSGKHFQLCFCLLPCSQLFWSLTGSTVNLKGAFPFSVFYILPLLASHFQLLSSFPSFWKILKLFSHVTGSFSLFFFFFWSDVGGRLCLSWYCAHRHHPPAGAGSSADPGFPSQRQHPAWSPFPLSRILLHRGDTCDSPVPWPSSQELGEHGNFQAWFRSPCLSLLFHHWALLKETHLPGCSSLWPAPSHSCLVIFWESVSHQRRQGWRREDSIYVAPEICRRARPWKLPQWASGPAVWSLPGGPVTRFARSLLTCCWQGDWL